MTDHTPLTDEMRYCDSCAEAGVSAGEAVCQLCGSEQSEPFRVGWDESD